MTINHNTAVLLRCLLFWSLLLLSFFAFSPFMPLLPGNWSRLMTGVAGTCCALLLTGLFLRYEKRSFRDIGLVWQRGTGMRLVQGLLIGSALFAVILLALVSLTPLQLRLNTAPFEMAALPGYLAFIPLSLMEEIGFRAYPMVRLHQRFGLRATQLFVAIAFALYHVAYGQDITGSFLGPGIYAFVFGLAAIWSKGIAVPTGIHIALNILQPLTGMRGDSGAVWVLRNETGTSNHLATPETVGLAMQLLVFMAALLLTEYYIRKRHQPIPQSTGNTQQKNEAMVSG